MNEDNFDESIPTLSPNVENQLKYCLANEVKLYSTNAHGKNVGYALSEHLNVLADYKGVD